MATEITSWAQLTTEQLEWRKQDLESYVDSNLRDTSLQQEWIAEIEAELESRKSA